MSEKLEKKLVQLRSAAELKFDEATKAIEADDFELAETSRTEGDALVEKAKAVAAQIKSLNDVAGLKTPKEKPVKSDPVRIPFEGADDDDDKDEPLSVIKAVETLRYGDEDLALRAVTTDLYGSEYRQKRALQMQSFAKFIRYGERRLKSDEEELLRTVILLPDAIKRDIREGKSLASMKVDLQEMLGDLGGYLVPEDYRTEIISRLMGLTVIRQKARLATTNRDAVEWPKLEGGGAQYTSAVRVTWVDEIPASATGAQTNPTWGMLRVPVHTVMARTDISRNQLEDSAFNMLDIIADLFAEAMAMDEDVKFTTGRGGGEPLGILSGGTIAEPAPTAGIGEVNSGNASTLTADGIFDLVYALHSQYRGNADFIGARTTIRDIRKLKDGNSRYLWEDSLKMGQPGTLLGAAFNETESVPTVGANKYPLIFGDLRGYLIVERVGMTVERVTDSTLTGQNKVALFARRRLGGQVVEPWRFQVQKVSA